MDAALASRKENILNWLKGKHNILLILILFLAFFIRVNIYSYTINQPLWWDEADYTYTAKVWGSDLDTRDLWYYRRAFFWPLTIAAMFKLGLGETGARFLTLLFSMGTVWITYLIGKTLFNKNAGLLAAFGMAVARLPLFLSGRLLTELPATFLVVTGYYLFIRGYMKKEGNHLIYLSAFFLAFGIMIRFATSLAMIPLLVYVILNEKFSFLKNKHLWIFAFIILFILSPFLVAYKTNFPSGTGDFFSHYTNIGRGEDQPKANLMGVPGIWGFIKDIRFNMTWWWFAFFIIGCAIFIDMFVGIDMITKKDSVRMSMFILLWILIPLIFHGMLSEYVDERYLLWSYPALFAIFGMGMMKIYDLIKRYNLYIAIAFIAAILILGAIPQMKAGNAVLKEKRFSYQAVMESGLWLKEVTNPGDVIMSQSRPQHGYYAERDVYSYDEYNETQFDEIIKQYNAAYFVVSRFEFHPQWAYNYGASKNLSVANAWFQDEARTQPLLVIYKLN